ncbi:MAG: acyltransferase [Verrucomicrobiota bacterium]|jgi:fucose 4-O-acetylase-like acetyltransferase
MHGKRIAELDILRGVAIFGVLVLHSSFEGRFTQETLAVQAIMARLFDWAVLAFFFSSGFLYDNSVPFTMAVKKRSVSLLVPFLLYNAFYNLFVAGMGTLGWVHNNAFEMNSKILATGLFHSPAFQLYFLPYLFVISIGVCGLDKLTQRYHRSGYVVVLLLVLTFYLVRGYPEVSHGSAFDKLPLYLAAFLIGVIGGPFLKEPVARPWMIAAVLVVVLGVLVLSRLPVVSLAVPPLLVGVVRAISKMANSKLLLSMGVMSGSIYVWHTPVLLPAITRLLAHCGVPSLFNLFGSIGVTLVTCILLRLGLDALFVRVTKRQAPKYLTL